MHVVTMSVVAIRVEEMMVLENLERVEDVTVSVMGAGL